VEWLVESAAERMELLLGRLLRVALKDEDERVRSLAISGLWEDAEPDLIGPLTAILQNDPADTVRASAASALGAFVLAGELDELEAALAMRAEEALLAAYQSAEESIVVQARALESLAYSSEAGLRQMIEDAYYAPDDEMRLSAMRAMGRSADIRWRALVHSELRSTDTEMRAEAARAAGELEAKGAVPELILLLEDEHQPVRLAAIEALGQLGGRDARDALRELASGGDPDEAAAAEIALEEILFLDEAKDLTLFDEDATDDESDDDLSDDDYYQRSRNQQRPSRPGSANPSEDM
jgi:HEAT repeat protein